MKKPGKPGFFNSAEVAQLFFIGQVFIPMSR